MLGWTYRRTTCRLRSLSRRSPTSRNATRHTFSKVLSVAHLHIGISWVLTFENLCRAFSKCSMLRLCLGNASALTFQSICPVGEGARHHAKAEGKGRDPGVLLSFFSFHFFLFLLFVSLVNGGANVQVWWSRKRGIEKWARSGGWQRGLVSQKWGGGNLSD